MRVMNGGIYQPAKHPCLLQGIQHWTCDTIVWLPNTYFTNLNSSERTALRRSTVMNGTTCFLFRRKLVSLSFNAPLHMMRRDIAFHQNGNTCYICLVVWNGLEHFLFFHIVGMSSSQLTFIFFRGVDQPDMVVHSEKTTGEWSNGSRNGLGKRLWKLRISDLVVLLILPLGRARSYLYLWLICSYAKYVFFFWNHCYYYDCWHYHF